MPRKYILLKELYAKSPFPDGEIRFVVKRKEKDHSTHSQIEFSPKPISSFPEEYMDFSYESSQSNDLGLFVIAISPSNRVANLGCIHLCLDENVWEKKEYLKGIIQQNGYVIYSSRDEEFSQKGRVSQAKLGSQVAANQKETVRLQENESQGQKAAMVLETPLKALDQSIRSKDLQYLEARTESVHESNNQSIFISTHNLSAKTDKRCQSEILKFTDDKDLKAEAYGSQINESLRSANSEAYQQATALLQEHKLKNSQYRQHLMQMEAEFHQQQIKLKQLGLIQI